MMGISTQTITVDLSKQLTRPQVVRLGQGDKLGTTLIADIYDNGVAYNLNGKTARFSMRAPDGSSSYSVAAASYSGNKATFDLDETYAASIAGKTDTAYIEVLSGSTVICSTSRITVIVYRSASQGLPVSGAYSDALEEAIAAAEAAIEAMGDISELAVPEMTESVRGGAKLGSGLAVSDGALSVSPIPDASIDSVASGDSQTGAQSLSLTGLSRLWAKMRAAFAAMSHVHSADDVTTGTLPVARGGTGVSAAAAERERLGLGSTTGALPIANGGTGATTAAAALTALGAAAASEIPEFGDGLALDGDTLSVDLETADGVLPVAHGGTGLAASPSALVDLESSAAASMMQASPRPGVTGTLPVARGGTGVTTLNTPQFRTAIGLGIYASLMNQSSSLTLTTSSQKVPLHGSFAQYGGCSESDNGIKVPVAGIYLVTGLAYFTTGFAENDMIHAELRKNGSPLGDSMCRVYLANAYQSFAAPTRIVSLAANDVITLHAWNQTAERGTVESRNGHGIMLVKIA